MHVMYACVYVDICVWVCPHRYPGICMCMCVCVCVGVISDTPCIEACIVACIYELRVHILLWMYITCMTLAHAHTALIPMDMHMHTYMRIYSGLRQAACVWSTPQCRREKTAWLLCSAQVCTKLLTCDICHNLAQNLLVSTLCHKLAHIEALVCECTEGIRPNACTKKQIRETRSLTSGPAWQTSLVRQRKSKWEDQKKIMSGTCVYVYVSVHRGKLTLAWHA